ncbi:MAG: ribosomal protein L11 methyltransferase [Candidatus Fluviicola riflensis]|nr:MAG: 50S ribosomal protein L11 methyltransferase [Candidatus Fluviicola riflensis]OGS79970.1 MAG: ribosomal protein L11 methyltransferase [Candidatus Fluviicola riflensis]OGS82485.1 MAG: ribosomal protein L11 methyltransferase [Fluviicola sp. RIFCSPHIGHO2_01_FULL_43_53]OGS88149.1 MAG: ribosomal protein L11 methyltransferase [Fluviicola sp. RIFCSPHIGHO2_12_FULL_43_24]
MDYIEVTIDLQPRDPWAEVLIAELAELGFESFVETTTGIQAFAPVTIGSVDELLATTSLQLNSEVAFTKTETIIPHQNWNAQWEADFDPVEVDDRLVILAPFHDASVYAGRQQIIIQPQMSFGTGHHQTTYLMSQYLLDMETVPAKVLDMGTGTGVLAILAEKLGATDILAIDIEPWSVENTIENAERNACKHIRTATGDSDLITETDFGLILANINKNVLKKQLPIYHGALVQKGMLLLSGFFVTDAAEMIELGEELGFEHLETIEKETWAAVKLIKK